MAGMLNVTENRSTDGRSSGVPGTGTPRILLTRTSHIGDCVLTLPMLCALRDAYPNAYIAWAVECPSDQFLSRHSALDQVIPLRRGWLKRPSEIWQLRRVLRSLQFDIAIDSQSRTRSSIVARLSGAPRRIGWKHPQGKEVSLVFNNDKYVSERLHLVDRQLDLLRAVNIQQPQVRFDYPLDACAQRTIDDFLASIGAEHGFVAMNPGAGWASRRWSMDRYAQVAQHLQLVHNRPCLVTWAGDEEYKMAQEIAAGSRNSAQVAPLTNLHELAALLRRALFYLGSDTGPMHFAAAVGTPCVGLFGPTRPECSGAYGPEHLAVQAYYQAGGGIRRRHAANRAMMAIDAAAVCQACDAMLSRVA